MQSFMISLSFMASVYSFGRALDGLKLWGLAPLVF